MNELLTKENGSNCGLFWKSKVKLFEKDVDRGVSELAETFTENGQYIRSGD